MKSYLAKIKSELEFLSIPVDMFINVLKKWMVNIYDEYQIKTDSLDILSNELKKC